MYDSTDPHGFPQSPAELAAAGILIAGYVDGKYQWPAEAWAEYQAAGVMLVKICISPAYRDAHVLDIEPGNADATDSVAWTKAMRIAGLETPTVYAGSQAGYSWGDIINAHTAAGILPPAIWWSNPNGDTALPAGCIARQYLFAGAYDASTVADYWPQVDTGPAPDLSVYRKYAADATTRIQAAVANDTKALESLRGW